MTGNLTTLEIAVKLAPRNRAAFRTLAHVRSAQGKTTEAAFALQQARLCQFLDKAEEDSRLAELRAQSKARVPGFIAQREQARKQAAALAQAREASSLPPEQEFVLVSGLPRSGTSLMMQMLKAGGMDLMSDGLRGADEDNPAGYWEWEDIKMLPQQPLVIERAYGKVVKVISALLPSLPLKHRYKIIFMTRPVEDSDFEGGGQSEETFRIDQEAATLEHKPVMELQVFEGMDGGTAWCASGKGLFETRVA